MNSILTGYTILAPLKKKVRLNLCNNFSPNSSKQQDVTSNFEGLIDRCQVRVQFPEAPTIKKTWTFISLAVYSHVRKSYLSFKNVGSWDLDGKGTDVYFGI